MIVNDSKGRDERLVWAMPFLKWKLSGNLHSEGAAAALHSDGVPLDAGVCGVSAASWVYFAGM